MRSTACNTARSTSICGWVPVVHVGYWGQHGRCYGEGCSHGTHCIVLAEHGCAHLAWMRWAMLIRFTTTVAGRTWLDMPSTCFSCSTTLSTSLRSSGADFLVMPRKSGVQTVSGGSNESLCSISPFAFSSYFMYLFAYCLYLYPYNDRMVQAVSGRWCARILATSLRMCLSS
jgi:hypothetical protein